MAEFTTGEAVSLDLPVARIPSRAAAFVIDLLAQLGLAFGLYLVLGFLLLISDADSAWFSASIIVALVTVLVGYPVVSETLSDGRSLGKLVMGLRVIRSDAGPIDVRHALTRGLAGAIVDFWMFGAFGAVAVVCSLCSPQGRRVGDVLAGTVVVHTRVELPMPALVAPPPWLAQWAAALELSGFSDDLAGAVRRYLTRLRTLTPAATHELGTELAVRVCAVVHSPVPRGYPPYHVLAAVLAERQRRELTAVPALR
ncbi:RDD family protein [Nocardia thailandica]|uniref:RDD family protein n=1 Tax=Nocardia thailandica TaxID=257275 RepID=A0ABW6PGF8_9NOCA